MFVVSVLCLCSNARANIHAFKTTQDVKVAQTQPTQQTQPQAQTTQPTQPDDGIKSTKKWLLVVDTPLNQELWKKDMDTAIVNAQIVYHENRERDSISGPDAPCRMDDLDGKGGCVIM